MEPSLQLLLFFSSFSICARPVFGDQTVFTINSVQLKVFPGTEVESGTNVTLHCEADVSQGGGQPLTYQFSFFRDQDPVYSENVTDPHVSYLLMPARAVHSGDYLCSIKILLKEKKSNLKTINVLGLQTPVLILNKPSVMEGEELTAWCNVPKESGKLCFYFYANSTEVQRQCITNNSAQVQLMLQGGGLQYLQCNVHLYRTRMKSNNSNTEKVLVTELYTKPTVSILPSSRIIEGDRLEVQCDVKLLPISLPKLQVFLSKASIVLGSGHRNASWETESALAEHSGNYTCKSEINDVQKSISVTVDVAELFSKPVLTIYPPEVFEGQKFNLSCQSANFSLERITKNDVIYSIYKDNEVLSDWKRTAKLSHSGHYACEAVAKTIRKHSSMIALKVKELVSSPLIMVQGNVILDRTFVIICRSEKGSLPISYTLLKGHQPLGVYIVRSPSDQAVFNVSIQKNEEIRDFACEAENNGHESKKLGPTLNAVVIESVSKPELHTTSYIEEGSDLLLKCSVEKGSSPITFTWYRDKTMLHTQPTNQWTKVYTVQNVIQASSYHCEAVNLAGERMQSSSQTVKVMQAKWKKVLIGIFILLSLIGIIAGVLLCRHMRGKKSAIKLPTKATSPKLESDSVTVRVVPGADSYSQVNGDDMRKTVWSESTSDSNSEEQSSEDAADKPDLEYAEHIQLEPMVASEAPLKKGTDTVYSEVQSSTEDAVSHTDAGSVEYAQLNHADLEPV